MNSRLTRFAPAQPRQQVEDLRLDRDVQRRGRLVEDQQRRLAGKRGGDQRALLHAAAELMRIGACHLGRARRCPSRRSSSVGAAHRGVGAQAEMLHQRLGDLAADPQRRVERRERVLEHRADPPSQHRAALRWRERAQVAPLEEDARRRSRHRRRAGRGWRRRCCFCRSPIRRRCRAPRRRRGETRRRAPPPAGLPSRRSGRSDPSTSSSGPGGGSTFISGRGCAGRALRAARRRAG